MAKVLSVPKSSDLLQRLANYKVVLERALQSSDSTFVLTEDRFAKDVPGIVHGCACVILSGTLDTARFPVIPDVTRDSKTSTFVVDGSLELCSLARTLELSDADIVTVSMLRCPPSFKGQSKAMRAVTNISPSSADILRSNSEVLVLRADRSVLLSILLSDTLRCRTILHGLTEVTARLQDICSVVLTPIGRGERPSNGVPFDLLIRDANNRRTFVPGIPKEATTTQIGRPFALEAIDVLDIYVRRRLKATVEQCLQKLYVKYGCLVTLNGLRYPLNKVPVRLPGAPRPSIPGPLRFPKVSILTITRNRPRLMLLAANNFMSIDYPSELLEWVIVDDSSPGSDASRSLGALRKDPRVKYIRIEAREDVPLSVGLKRNIACKTATSDYFVHMDDDDYLFPHSVRARLEAMQRTGAQCCGSSETLCFDVHTHKTYYARVTDVWGDAVYFAEPGMMYTREFWKRREWSREWKFDEGRRFLENRDVRELVDIYPMDNVVMISHKENMTMDLRNMEEDAPVNDPQNLFSDAFCRLLRSVHRI